MKLLPVLSITRSYINFTRTSCHIFMNKMKSHSKALTQPYPRSDIRRFDVPSDKISWSVSFPGYEPVDHTADSVKKMPPWADIDFRNVDAVGKEGFSPPKWNARDGKVDRTSHAGEYVVEGGVPRNPVGRTGLKGRGVLGRWGPNHAADPIVTRWKKNSKNELVTENGKPILQFIAVQRRDNHEWAIPGGMVDPGEVVSATLKREFGEEALNSLEASPKEKQHIKHCLDHAFAKGEEVYRGYVDDPRNTDNAWMETIAINFHDAEGEGIAKFKLQAGDDAVGVKWTDLKSSLKLFASHIDFLHETAKRRGAYW